MTELNAENFFLYASKAIEQILLISDNHTRAERFTDVMNKAREFDLEEQTEELARNTAIEFNEPELWELPQTFKKNVALQPFPLDCLSSVLQEFLKAVSEYVQIVPEMAVLPLLSVLSLCVQGKAVVKHPGNNHTEPLNLYTMTIAAPGERKSGSFKEFMRPVEAYQEHYNALHKAEIEQYKTERAFLERQKQAAMNGKSASLDRAREITQDILNLEEKHELRLNVNDVTPEALAWEMYLQGGKIGVVDDEGSVFDVLSGLYSGGAVNINIFLKAYDGANYTILRRTKENIDLKKPLQAATALARQQREVVIPEVDSYVYNVMCTNAGSAPEAVELTADNIYTAILEANEALDTAEAPETDRVLVVTPQTYTIMKKCPDITMETDIGNEMRVKGVIGMLDGCTVIKIPANRLPEGFGFMVAHPCATVAPTKLEDYRIHQDPPGISGSLVEGRICYDAFVLENKKKAIYYQATV